MKKFLLITTLYFSTSSEFSIAQIVNSGFENWTPVGPCSDPNEWDSPNPATGLFSICVADQETSNVNSGSSALTLTSANVPGIGVIPGLATTGTIDIENQTISGGQPFSERPIAFNGWYRASPVAGDLCFFRAILVNENSGDTVGIAEHEEINVVNSFVEFTAQVNYYSSEYPTLLQIILSSSNLDNPQAGSSVTFDDLEYETVSVSTNNLTSDYEVKTFPNPTISDVFFSLGGRDVAFVEVFNMLGTKIHEQRLTNSFNSISMGGFPSGPYIWQLSTTDGHLLKTGKLMLAK